MITKRHEMAKFTDQLRTKVICKFKYIKNDNQNSQCANVQIIKGLHI